VPRYWGQTGTAPIQLSQSRFLWLKKYRPRLKLAATRRGETPGHDT